MKAKQIASEWRRAVVWAKKILKGARRPAEIRLERGSKGGGGGNLWPAPSYARVRRR